MANTRVPRMEGKSVPNVCLGGLRGSGPERDHAQIWTSGTLRQITESVLKVNKYVILEND